MKKYFKITMLCDSVGRFSFYNVIMIKSTKKHWFFSHVDNDTKIQHLAYYPKANVSLSIQCSHGD